MKEKKGISLIVLIVTIIVMIIIAGAVIISLTETNIIDQAETAVEKHNISELKTAASMAYSNWLLEEKTGKNPGHVQNYIRKELIKQGVATWEDFSRWYITPTGGIEEIDQEALTLIVKIDNKTRVGIGASGSFDIYWGNEEYELGTTLTATDYEPGFYEVKIKGENVLDMELDTLGEYVIAVKGWGNLGLTSIKSNYDSFMLEYISVPNENSFKEMGTFIIYAKVLQEIPDKLFKNCNKLGTVIFSLPELRYIPNNLFEGTDISNIGIDIRDCTSLENIPDWLK